jgi:hypothetical protein
VHDPLGQEQSFEIERVWLLLILDVYSRAALGYHVCLGAEYSRYDVIRTIENALAPHRRMAFTLAGLGYGSQGGFPSMKFPELAYATWQSIKLDNAKANLAQDTLHALCEFIGCSVRCVTTHSPIRAASGVKNPSTIPARSSSGHSLAPLLPARTVAVTQYLPRPGRRHVLAHTADHPTVEHPLDPHLWQRDVQPRQLFADKFALGFGKALAHFALEGFEPFEPFLQDSCAAPALLDDLRVPCRQHVFVPVPANIRYTFHGPMSGGYLFQENYLYYHEVGPPFPMPDQFRLGTL